MIIKGTIIFYCAWEGDLTVGCADCDVKMYKSLGFSIPLGNLLANE
jgi:hypothetical protein